MFLYVTSFLISLFTSAPAGNLNNTSTPQAALRGYIVATNSHAFTNVATYLHPNTVFWFQAEEYVGVEQVKGYFESTWSKVPDEVYVVSDVKWITNTRSSATCIFNYSYSGTFNGSRISGGGKGTNVFVKTKDGWKLIHEHLTPLKE